MITNSPLIQLPARRLKHAGQLANWKFSCVFSTLNGHPQSGQSVMSGLYQTTEETA